jgi:hypothetical protein
MNHSEIKHLSKPLIKQLLQDLEATGQSLNDICFISLCNNNIGIYGPAGTLVSQSLEMQQFKHQLKSMMLTRLFPVEKAIPEEVFKAQREEYYSLP